MIPKPSLVGLVAAIAIAVPAAATAELYRWVDERGGVVYGNVPPPGAKKLAQLDENNGRVSTVPGLSPEQMARSRELELAARVERLERELYEARARAVAAPVAYPYPAYDPGYASYPAYYPGYSTAFYGTYFPAAFRGHRFAVRPIFPTAFPPRVHHPIVARSAPVAARGGGMRR
jgi:hypothetical protein